MDQQQTDRGAEPDPAEQAPQPSLVPLLARASVGGFLMGLANLVPGISGGTMLVAAGVYRAFIDAIGDVTRLRLSVRNIALIATIVASAGIAIVALAGFIADRLVDFRWGMYSLFIGLTLGGAPLLVRLTRPFSPPAWAGLAAGLIAMGGLVLVQSLGASGGGTSNSALLLLAGVAGASAMILPGLSGAYVLLLLGQYEPIINAVRAAKDAASERDLGLLLAQAPVIIPVGIGVVVGVVAVGNLLKWVLHRYEKATLGVLLGLLLAAPLGLYPFKQGVEPQPGDTIEGQLVTEANLAEFLEDPKDWPEQHFTPTPGHLAGSVGLIVLGVAATWGLSLIGGKDDDN